MVTLEQRVTLSSPYFTFNIQDEETKPFEPISPSYSDKRVRVEVSGLNDRRQISITRVGDDASLRCQAIVVASSSPLLPIHGVRYGWEWRYVDEDPVSTTNVAVSLEANRERLGLRGIRAPPGTRGRNVKGRCVVHVPASQVDPSLPADQLLVYGSDYFSIDVIKKPTALDPDIIPLPGKDEDGIRVKVIGLDENGHLTGSEKESVAVNCEVQNATTNKRLSTDGMRAEYNVLYGWEFTDVTGRSIDSSLFADGLSTDANGELRLRGLSGPRRGDLPFKIRCVAIVSKRPSSPDEPAGPVKSYVSDFFAVAVTRSDGSSTVDVDPGETPPDITGKLITLHVEGLKPDGTLTALPGETVELQCVATESTTGDTPDELTYGWELRRTSGGLLTLGLVANQVTQDGNRLQLEKLKSLDGIEGEVLGRCLAYRGRQIYRSYYFPVKIALTPKGQEIEGMSQCDGRIVVTVDGLDPTLRAAKIKPDSTHNLTCVPKEKPVYPKYRVVVDGLDEHGGLSGRVGDSPTLKCEVFDALSGDKVEDVFYYWDIRRTDEEAVSSTELVTRTLESYANELRFDGLKPIPGSVKGRCIVTDHAMKTWDASPYFYVNIATDEVPVAPEDAKDKKPSPIGPKEANATDDRVTVIVTGLDENGNFVGKIGDDAELVCNAQVKDGIQAEVISRGWSFTDQSGRPVAMENLADEVSISISEGKLNMKRLRKPSVKYLHGQCMVETVLVDKETSPDGSELETRETVLYASDKFGISHTEDGVPSEDIVGKDVQGKKIIVNVDGLQADNVLHAETGDKRTLTCFAKDSFTGEVVPSAIYYWEFRDQVGQLIPMDHVAERVARKHNSIEFQHLRPTDRLSANEQRFGRCVVYDTENEHFYRSPYFHLDVRRPDFEDATGPDNRVEVHVKGITPDGILVAEEGETATLECVAFDKDRNENIQASTAVYQFQFTEAVPDSADVYGGHVARVVEQEPLESGGIKLTLEGLKSGTWHKGRCVVLLISEDDKDPSVPVRRYGSKYFWSGVTKPDERREPPEETKNKPVVISGYTNDPLVLVKVDGVNANDTITAKPGDDILLRGYAIDVPTGKPIEGMKYSWDIRTLDNRPLDSNDLAESVSTGDPDDTLIISGYRPSGEGVQVRLIATATEAVKDLNKRGKKYASPVYIFQTSEPKGEAIVPPPEPRNRYDPSMLQLEVVGLNPDGTLSRKEGEDVRLACEVVDRHTGMPIEDEFDFGWSIGTGPDGRPVALNNLAESVKIRKGQLELAGLQRTSPKSGGLRSYCTVRLKENQLLHPEDYPDKTVSLNSDTFVIHVEPPDDVPVEEPEEKDIPPFINWIPGKDPKNAVIVKVFELDQDGSVDVNPGGNLTLSCMALDAVSLQKIVPTQTLTPVFTWELRTSPGGQLLDYGHVTNGEVSVTQPSPGEDSSRLELHGFRHTPEMGSDFVGRCTVRLKEQIFRSDYFRIEIEGSRQLEDYETAPKDYWATDDAVKVIVNGLNADGNLVTSEGSNANLNCEARDSKTNELLPPAQVNYGWQLIEPRNDALMTPLSETGHFAGPELQLNQLYLPEWEERRFTLWGWCVVEVLPVKMDEGDKPNRYRSKPFMFIVQPKELPPDAKPEEVIPREELFIKVNGLTDDGHMKVNEGDDKTLECVAIETTTGRIHKSSSVNYGWEWRTLDGGIADVNAIAESVHSSDNQIQIKAVKPTNPIKGRCVVIARPQDLPPSGDSKESTELSWKVPRRYMSDFFFVDVEPVDPKTEEDLKTNRPIVATDNEIQVEVDPTVDGEIQLQAGTSAKLAIVTKDKDGTPVQPLSTGYELVYLSGKVAQTGEIADEVEFTAKEGALNLNKIRYPTRPVKLRVYVQMPPKEPAEGEVEEGEETRSQSPRIYYSDYLPIQVGTPEDETRPDWTDRSVPVYDVTGEKFKVRIVGLDDNGNAAGVPNESMELTCAVTDKFDFDAELKPNAYSWQFVDGDGHPLNPGVLAEQVVVESGNKLRLIGYRSAVQQTVARGRCIINIQVPVPINATVSAEMPPTQRYVSPYFSFTVKDGLGPTTPSAEPVITGESVTTPEEVEFVTPVIPEELDELKPKRFTLQLDSPTNPLYELEDNKNTILARVQRPFELNCRAVFAADAGTERSSTGEQLPRLVWYYRQPEIPGDVPIPSQLFPVQPPRMETLVITPQVDYKISIESDVYSFRDDVAEFHCNAYMESDELAAQKIVYVQKIKEKFNVRIFDEDSRSRVYAFVGSTKKLTCYVNDINSGDRVEPESYQWEVSTGDGSGEWLRGFSDRQPAEVVSGWSNNQLLLESLRLAEGTTALQTTYEFRCTVAHNATFDTTSRPFVMSVRTAPAIYSSDAIAYTVNDEMSLQCTDEASSPESTVEWKFEPLGATPTERKNPILLGKTYAYGRIYIFAIARGQLIPEHSGKYTCTATNPHGTASSTIEVTVTEELQRGSRRVSPQCTLMFVLVCELSDIIDKTGMHGLPTTTLSPYQVTS
ncbi:hypothetical protein EG68_04484 [Paragonimus skrjabini miyazakii]|uniref:Ig-like domain-containing protein n=1 Tax=Paragonimus skrjabini miyazakii TaxID=59628 RepID=A0A8S9YUW7_9TREM|nr:hypothetical protein EG68_04484 [Paragonimus skrjabini miyazakii]